MSDLALIALVAALTVLAVVAALIVRERRARAERQRAEQDLDQAFDAGRKAVKAVVETAALVRERGIGGAFRSSIEQLEGWAEQELPDLRRLARDGKVAIAFSDIENSTALNERMGDRSWVRVLSAHDELIREHVEARGGEIVKSQGDGFMIAFSEPGDALAAAAQIQRRMADPPRRLRKADVRVRIGVHYGKAVRKDGDLFGRNVALAARIADQAEGGQVLASEDAASAVGEPEGYSLVESHKVELKGIPGEHTLSRVVWQEDGEPLGKAAEPEAT